MDATVSNCLQDELDEVCRTLEGVEDPEDNISCRNQRYARFDGSLWRCYSNLRGKQRKTLSCVDEFEALILCQEGHSVGGTCPVNSRVEQIITANTCGVTTTTTTTTTTTSTTTTTTRGYGTWEPWDNWSPCTAARCQIGIRHRVRYCTTSECIGVNKQIQFCQVTTGGQCDVKCNVNWKSITGANCDLYTPEKCSSTGLNLGFVKLNMTINSENDFETIEFVRQTIPVLNGQWSDANGVTALVCPQCGCTPTWSDFGPWSTCSSSCGTYGTQLQMRDCQGGTPGDPGCQGDTIISRNCNRKTCRKLIFNDG